MGNTLETLALVAVSVSVCHQMAALCLNALRVCTLNESLTPSSVTNSFNCIDQELRVYQTAGSMRFVAVDVTIHHLTTRHVAYA